MKGVTKERISYLIGKTETGEKIQLHEQSEMEQACIKSNIRRFTQANKSLAASERVLQLFGTLAEKDAADEVLNGTLDTSVFQDKYFAILLDHLQRVPHAKRFMQTSISKEEH